MPRTNRDLGQMSGEAVGSAMAPPPGVLAGTPSDMTAAQSVTNRMGTIITVSNHIEELLNSTLDGVHGPAPTAAADGKDREAVYGFFPSLELQLEMLENSLARAEAVAQRLRQTF